MTTSRQSPRCLGAGQLVDAEDGIEIIDCPVCGRPGRGKPAFDDGPKRVVPPHGTVRTRNTDAADDKLRRERDNVKVARIAVGVEHPLQPSHAYACEHDDCGPESQLTIRTESSERYCFEHFPYIDEAERRAVVAAADVDAW